MKHILQKRFITRAIIQYPASNRVVKMDLNSSKYPLVYRGLFLSLDFEFCILLLRLSAIKVKLELELELAAQVTIHSPKN